MAPLRARSLLQKSVTWLLAMSGTVAFGGDRAVAQNITLDGSLGTGGTLVGPNHVVPQAVGRSAGGNLFHSFGQFNLLRNQSLTFQSDATIRNILARVTGGRSSINGLIATQSRAVNLFLINPNGITFGQGARLNVGGSFIATTADEIWFGNQGRFHALPTVGEDISLLTIDPSAVRFNQAAGQAIAPIAITTDSGRITLAASNRQSLLLIGGELTFERATLTARGGRIELGALAQAATIGLQPGEVGSPFRQHFPADVARANIGFSRSIVNVEGSDRGDIAVYGHDMTLVNASSLESGIRDNQGSATSRAGDIVIDATGSVLLSAPRNNPRGASEINAISNEIDETSLGKGGNITITAASLTLFGERAQIRTLSLAERSECVVVSCDAGNITVNVGTLNFDNPRTITTRGSGIIGGSQGLGNGGNIQVTVRGNAYLGNRGRIQSDVELNENDDSEIVWRTGSIAVTAQNLELSLGRITSNVILRGASNNIRIVVDTLNLNRSGRITSNIGNSDDPAQITGRGGNISIEGRSLSLTEGGFIEANTNAAGDGGNLLLNFSESMTLSGLDQGRQFRSRISAAAQEAATGRGGTIEINTRNLSLSDGAAISARTEGAAAGGSIAVNAQNLNLTLGGQILTTTLGSGDAGSMTVNVPGRLWLSGSDPAFADKIREALDRLEQGIISSLDLVAATDGEASGLFARTTRGSGDAGNITVRAGAIQIEDGAQIAASAIAPVSTVATTGAGGDIDITADQVQLQNRGQITVGSEGTGQSGNLAIAAPILTLNGGSRISAETLSSSGGNILLNLDTLLVNNSQITASTQTGQAGNLTINATDQVQVSGTGGLSVAALNGGEAGSLSINTRQLMVEDGAQIALNSTNQGAAGTLQVTANDLLLTHGAGLSAETQRGTGGNIQLRIVNSLRLSGYSQISASTADGNGGNLRVNVPIDRATTSTQPVNLVQLSYGSRLSAIASGTGNAGSVTLNARQLTIQDVAGIDDPAGVFASSVAGTGGDITLQGLERLDLSNGRISASTQSGRGGSLAIDATGETVTLSGTGGLFVEAGNGSAGNIEVMARHLRVENGARISASNRSFTPVNAANRNFGNIRLQGLDTLTVNQGQISASTQTGQAGSLIVNAANGVRLNGSGGLAVAATGTGGIAGDLRIRTGRLEVANGARVTVSGSQGQAGNLTIAAQRIRLDRGELTAETGARGANQANIQLRDLDLLVLRNGSQISARASARGNGGNVAIAAGGGYVIAVPTENSDIIANAEAGNGGDIDITTQSIIGLEQTNSLDPRRNLISEINASSQFGLNGNVVINTPGVEPGQGLLDLPTGIVDASQLIAQGCAANEIATESRGEFVVTGRGGLPPNPEEPLQQDAVMADWVSVSNGEERSLNVTSNSPEFSISPASDVMEITEAQGWKVDAEGQVLLIAQSPTVAPASSGLPATQCPAL